MEIIKHRRKGSEGIRSNRREGSITRDVEIIIRTLRGVIRRKSDLGQCRKRPGGDFREGAVVSDVHGVGFGQDGEGFGGDDFEGSVVLNREGLANCRESRHINGVEKRIIFDEKAVADTGSAEAKDSSCSALNVERSGNAGALVADDRVEGLVSIAVGRPVACRDGRTSSRWTEKVGGRRSRRRKGGRLTVGIADFRKRDRRFGRRLIGRSHRDGRCEGRQERDAGGKAAAEAVVALGWCGVDEESRGNAVPWVVLEVTDARRPVRTSEGGPEVVTWR